MYKTHWNLHSPLNHFWESNWFCLWLLFKVSHSRPLFYYFCLFYCTIGRENFADVWKWTADLWGWKRPLYQLSHNHCPSLSTCNSFANGLELLKKSFCLLGLTLPCFFILLSQSKVTAVEAATTRTATRTVTTAATTTTLKNCNNSNNSNNSSSSTLSFRKKAWPTFYFSL